VDGRRVRAGDRARVEQGDLLEFGARAVDGAPSLRVKAAHASVVEARRGAVRRAGEAVAAA
jgi:hypothetical protein